MTMDSGGTRRRERVAYERVPNEGLARRWGRDRSQLRRGMSEKISSDKGRGGECVFVREEREKRVGKVLRDNR